MKYKEWLDEWLVSCVKPLVKERTYECYGAMVRTQITPKLGDYVLDELSPSVLQKFTAELTQRYAPNTVKGVIAVVKGSLTRAERTGIVGRQYSGCIQRPRGTEKQVDCFTVAEQKKIERYIFNSGKARLFGIVLCLYTGLRLGELLALEWRDINFEKGILSVTKTCRDKWGGEKYIKQIGSPKTASSVRRIPVPKQILPYLKLLKKQSKSRYVVSGGTGKDVCLRSYQKSFEVVLRNLKIPHKGFHSLRHTFATRALECGMDVKTLSEILGHKSPTVTLNRYVHSLIEHKSAMMNKVGKLLQ